MKKTDKKPLKCPSAKPSESSELFGIVNKEGKVNYLKTPLKINASFIDTVSSNTAPDQRFRFTSKCVESGCKHWKNDSKACNLASDIVSKFKSNSEPLPFCAIRDACRWYAQEGKKACTGCAFVRRSY